MTSIPDSRAPQPTLPPERFSNLRLYAEGGASWVYLAYDVELTCHVVIKLLKPGADSERLLDCAREGWTMAQLKPENICQVFDIGECPEGHYVSMEYIDGPTLRDWMTGGEQRNQPLPSLHECLRIFSEVATTLDFAHSQGVVHGDLKPENVLLSIDSASGRLIPKLIDFSSPPQASREFDAHRRVAGTLPYMAPEQLLGEGVSPCTDLYSLGVMLYESLAGELSYQGDQEAIFRGHLSGRSPNLPEPLIKLQPSLAKALAKNPRERFDSCESLIRNVEEIVARDSALHALFAGPPIACDARHPRGWITEFF